MLGALYTENGKSEYDAELAKLSHFYNTIEYLPIVFLGFYTTAEMNRLYLIMTAMLSLSTHTTDLGTRLAAMVSPPVESAEHRRWLYKMYRYLNLQHYLCYSELVFGADSTTELDGLLGAGLLLAPEAEALRGIAYGLGHHHMVCAWMCQEYLARYSPADAVTEGLTYNQWFRVFNCFFG